MFLLQERVLLKDHIGYKLSATARACRDERRGILETNSHVCKLEMHAISSQRAHRSETAALLRPIHTLTQLLLHCEAAKHSSCHVVMH
jgi:hypothetical protein